MRRPRLGQLLWRAITSHLPDQADTWRTLFD
jgi:hypothetical protein